ncbi:hypothetical protein BAE30_04350 [Acidithiobacillus caldus]|uniref:Uncharacterized protein n=1 Tax=Acidithiobacillus caldus TaxID=33059 RepID=A0A1E7YYQ2_9PROT|nr:hypothetical protein BAE30_04350 [Acidithiobacillus caldus]
MSLKSLTLMHQPAVAHVVFGIFNLAWPNIAFWAVGLVFFGIGVYARMPHFMEMDKNTRKRYENEQMKKQEHEGEKR